MLIGLTYDTHETYNLNKANSQYHDFSSLAEVTSLKTAMERLGYEVRLLGSARNLIKILSDNPSGFDLVFNIAEGISSRNREGLVAAILEASDIPFVGTDAYGLSLSMNKVHTKLIAQSLGIPTPKFVEITALQSSEYIKLRDLNFPLILKPICEGTSMGVTKVLDYEEAVVVMERLFKTYQQNVLCEEYIHGHEIAVPIIGCSEHAAALGVVEYTDEYDRPLDMFTTELKLYDDYNTVMCSLDSSIQTAALEYALKLYCYIGALDLGRVDFRVDSKGTPYFLEMNLIPSLELESSFAVCGASMGLSYHQIISKIIESAWSRYKPMSSGGL